MKIVRLNDKMWFGKYIGLTIKDILNRDKKFLDNLVNSGLISYHDNVLNYLENGNESKSKTEYRWYRTPPINIEG